MFAAWARKDKGKGRMGKWQWVADTYTQEGAWDMLSELEPEKWECVVLREGVRPKE